jgi:hypothetical protein
MLEFERESGCRAARDVPQQRNECNRRRDEQQRDVSQRFRQVAKDLSNASACAAIRLVHEVHDAEEKYFVEKSKNHGGKVTAISRTRVLL